ncbi:mycothiol system anti-sigma-R factor [Saccharothrix algeriensis]|uniref:Mycothiol system anti-sigma-R factor n=1 Tax=Saccharothrix algeriensis TaxID=173560 RepID=A0A8T8HSV5_9PSEU|nr:mycothiol system anti-sigma-R factor [Saccharothrix algeriensis]MBM7813000.1 mycothiol system anti-sigma-R factor [Saccharothrix algeriensis]QTR01622.1 mycothiol system anti-sigma-R factor [Saccharothrix algeriensis]
MSCGKPHETDCAEVLSEVWLYLDHECDQGRMELLRTHLQECHPCLEEYGIEEHLKLLLAKKCGGEHAPEELRRRLRARIHEATVTSDSAVETVETIEVEVDVEVEARAADNA